MRRANYLTVAVCIGLGASFCPGNVAKAQPAPMFARFFLQPSVALAQLDEVQQGLKLNDKQKEAVVELNKELSEERMSIFQGAAGDRAKMREQLMKLYHETTAKFEKGLDEDQVKRSRELYVQLNGPMVLQGDVVAEQLKLSDEQKAKVQEALASARQDWMNAGLRDLGQEEAAKKVDELLKSRDEKLLAVLTDEQRAEFEKLKGKELKVDWSKLPLPGRS